METENITRKNFLGKFFFGWIALNIIPFIYAAWRYIIFPISNEREVTSVTAGSVNDFATGPAKIIKFNKKPIVLIRTEQQQIKALSAVCTHLGCIVEYKSDQKTFHCNCHGSVFDANGTNLSGPATKPLQQYRVEIKENNIIVSI